MNVAMNILMIALLFWIFYEDIKDRKVTLLVLLSVSVLGGFLHGKQQLLEVFFLTTLLNLAVVLLVIFVLFVYTKLKLKIALFEAFGLGDLLFFLCMAISFPTASFLVLFSASLIFSFVVSVVFQKQLKNLIPLAGLQALFLGLIIGTNELFQVTNLYAF
ncbi:hypothetical protein AAON49_05140 [Pseudotenacibaculum sp. MALMAid0570]|uniref:hypothetical protein n=1 Tax=Pseudotenacibaculum sp. MALMAid0570 TaxID=3143938 RepID=UPI0032DFDEFD